MSQAAAEEKLLKMSGLVEASGVPAPTIKHYLREGLLPEPVKTSRNMAWYRPETVERIRLIKRLQDERFMPLKAIRTLLFPLSEEFRRGGRPSEANADRRFAHAKRQREAGTNINI